MCMLVMLENVNVFSILFSMCWSTHGGQCFSHFKHTIPNYVIHMLHNVLWKMNISVCSSK